MIGPHHPPLRAAPQFSLIFPVYNAASVIAGTWDAVSRFLAEGRESWEVLFVCDGCTDDTAACLTELVARGPGNIRLLSYAPNRGKGHAVRRGLEAARGQWRVFTDVDLAYRFDDVARLAGALRAGADVAIASRMHPESRVVVPTRLYGYAYRRHLQSLIFSTVVRRLLPLKQHDTQAGLKGLSARAARLLLPLLRCDGFCFDCELLAICARLGVPVAEVPVTMQYDAASSTIGWRAMARTVGELYEIRERWGVRRAVPVAIPAEEWALRPAA